MSTDKTGSTIEEASLVFFLLNRDRFNKYYPYLKDLPLEQETKNFLWTIREFFTEQKDVVSINVQEFLAYFTVKHPVLRKREGYTSFMESLGEIKISSKVLEENLNNFLEQCFASRAVEKLVEVLDGNKFGVIAELQDLINEFNLNKVRLNKQDKEIFVTADLDELLHEEVYKPGLKWRLNCLNTDLGELRGGSLGHVFARVDTGKTSFMISEITNFATQLVDDEIILWCNNEEKGSKIKLRLYQALLGMTRDEMTNADAAELQKKFEELGGNRIRIYDEAIVSVEDIDKLCNEYNVRVLVVDQGDKVKFSGSAEHKTHERLKAAYGMFRELAKKYDMDVLTVGQASAEAEGVKWLRTDWMDSSKTGKPGELDYALGIGKWYKDVEEGRDFLRNIAICKNKMNNGIHGRHTVIFDSMRALYTDD